MLRIALGQVGDTVALSVVDRFGAPAPLDDASELVLLVRPPHGPVRTWSAAVVADPALSILGHVTELGDLDELGRWLVQPRLTLPSGTFRGSLVELEVLEALDAGLVEAAPALLISHLGAPWYTHAGAPLETH